MRRLLLVVILAWPLPAAAWSFREHTEIGEESYAAACAQVALEQKIDGAKEVCEAATDPVRARWCLACRVYTPSLYGQSVAIAGDHVGSPEALMSVAGQRTATSLADYAFLALVNTGHYHPNSPRNWRTFHDRALAVAAARHDGGAMAQDFEKAFYTSAYADHFLHDAFASGHMGFSRASSSAGASKAFHDIWNNAGRVVKAPTGSCWLQYGDNKWGQTSQVGRMHLKTAAQSSVYDVLAAFVTERRDGAREVRPMYFVPIATTTDTLPRGMLATEGGGDVENVQETEQITKLSTAQKAKQPFCEQETAPIGGMSHAVELSAGFNYWGRFTYDRTTQYLAADVTFNHLLKIPLAFDIGASPLGAVQRGDRTSFAAGGFAGLLTPPLYLVHGLWRNEVGAQAMAYVIAQDPVSYGAYVTFFLRTSLEVSNTIVRLQVGPTHDLRNEAWGVTIAAGFELPGLRWVRGGGALGTR
jgi:hypothetical protein